MQSRNGGRHSALGGWELGNVSNVKESCVTATAASQRKRRLDMSGIGIELSAIRVPRAKTRWLLELTARRNRLISPRARYPLLMHSPFVDPTLLLSQDQSPNMKRERIISSCTPQKPYHRHR